MPNNTCSEDMVVAAYNHMFKDKGTLKFHTDLMTCDEQIDLSPTFMLDDTLSFNLTSKLRADLKNLIQSQLNPSKCYFVRTGTVGGSGHFQLLRYVQNQWEIYSTPTNRIYLTDRSGALLEDGAYNLQGNPEGTAIWGESNGNYMVLFTEITPSLIKRATNFIAKFRTSEGAVDDRSDSSLLFAMEHSEFTSHAYYSIQTPTSQLCAQDIHRSTLVSTPLQSVPVITKAELKACLDEYKTSYYILNTLIKMFSFGLFNHQSGTISALQNLLKKNQDTFSQDDICHAISSSNNHDSQKMRRVRFFSENIEAPPEGTDKVLEQIKQKFHNL